MHRRSPAPLRCAVASPPPLCTCSRCSCPPANKSVNSLLHDIFEWLKLFHLEISLDKSSLVLFTSIFAGLWELVENQPMNNISCVHPPEGVAWFSNQAAAPNTAAIEWTFCVQHRPESSVNGSNWQLGLLLLLIKSNNCKQPQTRDKDLSTTTFLAQTNDVDYLTGGYCCTSRL